jgi:single-stranded-DNA-specific exonuclease
LAPFGMGNPSPVFRSGAARVTAGPRVLKQRHLSFSLSQGARTYRALMWRGAERAAEIEAQRDALDVAYSLESNHYMGETTIELRIADLRQAQDEDAAVATGPAAAVS